MENYRVQIKIAKENVPSLLQHYDEAQVWEKIKTKVKTGNVELTVFERDDDYDGFEFPTDIKKIYEDWDKDFKGNLFLETDFLLTDEEANEKFVIAKFYDLLEKSNIELYSYFNDGDLYQSYGYIDDEFVSIDEDENSVIKQKEKNEREQLDMFKKKKKK